MFREVGLFRADDRVFDAMLDGWRAQMLARGLTTQTDLTADHPNSKWVFRGYSPGRHIHGASLRERLRVVFGTRAARLGTLHELTKLGQVPIIADALGYHPATIERHAIASASTYAQYIAAARDQRRSS